MLSRMANFINRMRVRTIELRVKMIFRTG